MRRKLSIMLTISLAVLMSLLVTLPVAANPPAPDGQIAPSEPSDIQVGRPARKAAKPIDQPNLKDYQRMRERQRMLEAGQMTEAAALAQTATDRVLVILVEFAGTDTFTWNPGDTWDPLGRADPNEAVYDEEGNVIVGDCSNIITEARTFTYTGPLHNQIPRPLSEEDRSGDTIWTEDFSPEWFNSFMFGNGVVFDYDRVDGSHVHEDFTGESVRLYYQDMSGGKYDFTGDVIGWVQVPHSTWWYGADQCPGARSGGGSSSGAIPGAGSARSLVRDALDAVNVISPTIPGFNWANYDRDGDGIIDRLWIVHSGYGEEDATTLLNRTDYGEASVWSHSSAITPPYEVAPGIFAGPYIIMPENGGIGVFAHEYGHNLGASDLYAYDQGETSAGFWTLMADDWTGYPIGFQPPAVDPWHLDNWGWLDPFVITDPDKVYEVTLGQASNFPNGENVYRGVKIRLPDGVLNLPVPIWQGDYYWWGGKKDLANAMMTTRDPIAIPEGGATLAFDLVYDIEPEWDFLWIQASEDGQTWNTLTNPNTQCVHDPNWIGGLYGFPDDLCGAGLGGFYGYNANWPDPEVQEFDLSAFAGKSIYLRFWFMTDWATTYTGVFVDNVKVMANGSTLFEDDAESGDAKWVYQDPWVRSDGTMTFTHNYYLQWRNVSSNGGYDSALGEPRWRFGPANTGLLVWYNNNFYTDNEIWHYLFDWPGFGSKGVMLVADSHPEPYRDPVLVAMGYNNEGGNVTSRSLMRDAPFSLNDTVDFSMKPPYVQQPADFEGRPAVSAFHDSMGYYPGAEYVRRGPAYPPTQFRWVTVDWDASVNVPSRAFYGIKAPGYKGTGGTVDQEFRFNCTPYLSGPYAGYLGCYWLGPRTGLGYDGGSGNPGDYDGQYGWHVQVLEQAEDGTWARVRIWNSLYEVRTAIDMGAETLPYGQVAQATYQITENIGGRVNNLLVIVEVPGNTVYIPGSEFGGLVPIPGAVASSAEEAAAYVSSLGYEKVAAEARLNAAQASEVRYLVWFTPELGTQMSSPEFGFSYQAVAPGTAQSRVAFFRDGIVPFQSVNAPDVTITPVEVTVDVPVLVDTHLSANEPTTNFGGWAKLYVGHNNTLRPVLGADLSAIPTTAEVTQATLYLWMDSFGGGGSPHTLSVHQVLTPWDEATATWRTPWSTAGGDFDPTAAGSATISNASVGQWVTIDLTSLVQGEVANPSANMGVLLQATGGSVSRFILASSEYWDSTKRPYLHITYRSPSE